MRHIWKGTVMEPGGTLIEVFVDLYPEDEQPIEDVKMEVALRRNSLDTWGPMGVLIFEGTDPPPIEQTKAES